MQKFCSNIWGSNPCRGGSRLFFYFSFFLYLFHFLHKNWILKHKQLFCILTGYIEIYFFVQYTYFYWYSHCKRKYERTFFLFQYSVFYEEFKRKRGKKMLTFPGRDLNFHRRWGWQDQSSVRKLKFWAIFISFKK